MSVYSLSVLTTNVTTGNACLEILTAAGERAYVRELGLTLNAATASTFGLGRPAAIGVTPTSPITFLAQENTTDVALTKMATAWGTGPTIPANFLRRISLPATIGAGIVWPFGPREFVIPVSASIILWNLSAVSAINVWAVIEE